MRLDQSNFPVLFFNPLMDKGNLNGMPHDVKYTYSYYTLQKNYLICNFIPATTPNNAVEP